MAKWNFVESVEKAGYSSKNCFIQRSEQGLIFGYRMQRGLYELTRVFHVEQALRFVSADLYISLFLDKMSKDLEAEMAKVESEVK